MFWIGNIHTSSAIFDWDLYWQYIPALQFLIGIFIGNIYQLCDFFDWDLYQQYIPALRFFGIFTAIYTSSAIWFFCCPCDLIFASCLRSDIHVISFLPAAWLVSGNSRLSQSFGNSLAEVFVAEGLQIRWGTANTEWDWVFYGLKIHDSSSQEHFVWTWLHWDCIFILPISAPGRS